MRSQAQGGINGFAFEDQPVRSGGEVGDRYRLPAVRPRAAFSLSDAPATSLIRAFRHRREYGRRRRGRRARRSRRRRRTPASCRARFDHVERLGDHRALDTAAGDRAVEIALAVDDQMAADRARCRTPGLDDGRDRHVAAIGMPFLGDRQADRGLEVALHMLSSFAISPWMKRRGRHRVRCRKELRPDRIRFKIVNRTEFVNMRQHGTDAAGACFETVETQQRIEPDQPPAGTMQPVHLRFQSRRHRRAPAHR